jgi:hypothetical protein
MTAAFKIHPGIGIARLGDSPDAFCISPEEPAVLPIECTSGGNPLLSPDGKSEVRVQTLKDGEGRIKRQAARFHVYVYDDASPEGRPLEVGDPVSGGGNQGTLVGIEWRVHLANKKASWYEFEQLEGEHGYAPGHPRRNAAVADPEARRQLIIDPGPRIVGTRGEATASFDRDGRDVYATTFPPPLEPCSIDTLGDLLTDDRGRLLVLGGHGASGSIHDGELGHPRIDTYANNDGWFDDTSDGPVTARLVMYSKEVDQIRYVDVEYPAWVIVGYPAYVPEVLDIVTISEVLEDTFVRNLAYRTDLYGESGTFADPQVVDTSDREALALWKSGRLTWNPDFKPWFYRDIWPILFRADEMSYLTSILQLSNFPHNQTARGNFDPHKLGVPPAVDVDALEAVDADVVEKNRSGDLFLETFAPVARALGVPGEALQGLRPALGAFAAAAAPTDDEGYRAYLRSWRDEADVSDDYEVVKERLGQDVHAAVQAASGGLPPRVGKELAVAVSEHLRKYESGKLLREYRRRRAAGIASDPYEAYRRFVFDALRKPGEEDRYRAGGKPEGRVHGLPLMPLLAGDNPISNTLASKFLRLTDLQYFLLRQWALGSFHNEDSEDVAHPDPWLPYEGWVSSTGADLDRGVMSNVLGGAFCPGGEVGWIMRNPAIYLEPFRIRADPAFSSFRLTAAQSNAWRGRVPEADYSAYVDVDLSQDDDFERGMQPGDLTKHMSLPWQSDFNECSTQAIDVTYEGWNVLYAHGERDELMRREERVSETLWWPAHRPMQTYELASTNPDGSPVFRWVDWARGVPQTKAGDLKMVTEWRRVGFVRRNPYVSPASLDGPSPEYKYVTVERTEREETP